MGLLRRNSEVASIAFISAVTLSSCGQSEPAKPRVMVTRGDSQRELLVDSELYAVRSPGDEARVTEVERDAMIHVRGSFDLPDNPVNTLKFVLLITQTRPDGFYGFANEISTAERGADGRFQVLQQIKAPSQPGTYMIQATASGYELQECPITVK